PCHNERLPVFLSLRDTSFRTGRAGATCGMGTGLPESRATARLTGPTSSWPMGDPHKIMEAIMARQCQVTGKRVRTGNNVSHANNESRRRWMPNLHERRFWVPGEKRWIKLRVSSKALRTIDKNGIEAVIAQLRARGEKI